MILRALVFAPLAALALAAQTAPPPLWSPDVTEMAQKVVAELYSLNHDRAEQISLNLIAAHPGEPLGHAMLARTLWARVLNNEQALSVERFSAPPPPGGWTAPIQPMAPDARKRFLSESAKAVSLSRARLQKDPRDRSALFVLGLAHLNLAAYEYSLNLNLWHAFRNGEDAFDSHRRLLQIEPLLGDPHMANGVALYLADVLPWKVKWLAVLLGFPRSREKGKREIEYAARTGVLVADDARTMLVLLNERDGQFDRAKLFLQELHRRYPRNYIVELELAGLEMRMGRFGESYAICRRILAKAAGRRDGYERLERAALYIRIGVSARETGRLDEAGAFLRGALDRGGAAAVSRPVALLELGKTLDLQGQRVAALNCYRQVSAAADVNGSTKDARRFMRRPYASLR